MLNTLVYLLYALQASLINKQTPSAAWKSSKIAEEPSQSPFWRDFSTYPTIFPHFANPRHKGLSGQLKGILLIQSISNLSFKGVRIPI